ncbi:MULTISPECIES: hypothetical protein [unclassified Haloferax]|jgi:hypothetical protein|uniref:DUF7289 family protein n=1 Tax=unclassified Haloferax TaxID=2625095 RepID=UPI002875F44D|nr:MULTISPECIES: hypothetical protein [unclassified Haloferax]MDS0243149.1 hypothetical protein [Haloferax sp. S2CR25]MDS0446270.1 hypothetical protein [Haloferax sp. S2CR25-2]
MRTKTTTSSTTRRDRAQSNVLAFILFFGLITTFVGAGAFFGISSLDQVSGSNGQAAAQSSMMQIRGDMYDLSSGAPLRTTELELLDSTVKYEDPITISISATSSNGTMETQVVKPRPIVYHINDVQYVYVSGAVFLQQDDGAVMKEGPSFRVDQEQAIIPLINTTHHDGPPTLSYAGDGTGYVVSHKWESNVTRYEPQEDGDPITATATMTVKTPRTKMWSKWFENNPRFSNVQVDNAQNTVSADFQTKRLFIKIVDVRVKFDI